MFNNVGIMGNLGQDPKITHGPNDTMYCSFNIAFKCRSKDSETRQYKTGWVRVTTFGRLAEICADRLVKGSKVLVSGALDYFTFKKIDNTMGSTISITADNVEFLNRKKEEMQEKDELITSSVETEEVTIG